MIRMLLISLFIYSSGFCCTTILVTKGASADGSLMVLLTDDNELTDQRIVFVPSKDFSKDQKRAVYPFLETGKRYIGFDRGQAYYPQNEELTKPLGFIDQIPHTYSYFDGDYPLINEHQLALGETTCASFFDNKEDPDKRILDITELERIALERCTKAKEAVLLMGELAEKYGFYGWGGEMVPIIDTEEGWIFEICSTPDQTGAIWVAKKVPDGEVFVGANEFRIREIDPNDPDILYSKNLFKIAKQMKWYDPNKPEKKLDWLKSVSPGEYNHPYYSLRRVWRVQSLLAPYLSLSPWVEDGYTKEYPFSIKPQKKLTLLDLANLIRDHYEKTEFDLTQNLAAGPFGSPDRYFGPYDSMMNTPDATGEKISGAWERPISIYYCGHSWICQTRKDLPDPIGGVAWIGLDAPASTCFVPFYSGMNSLPIGYQSGYPDHFDFENPWWAFNFVSNFANLKYLDMIKDIQKVQKSLEEEAFFSQSSREKEALTLYKKDPLQAEEFLKNYCTRQATHVAHEWWNLAKYLIEKYNDGYVNKPVMGKKIGYPKKWRDAVGYSKGPTQYKKQEP